METIIRANSEMGSPKMTAPFLMFLYGSNRFILNNDSDQVGKDAHDRTGDQDKDEYSGNPLFKVCILPKEMPCVEQEAHKKDYAEYNGKYGTYGVGNIIDRIFDAADLGEKRSGNERNKQCQIV